MCAYIIYYIGFLFVMRVFRKPTSPPLPLREGPPLISVFSPSGEKRKPLLLVALNRCAIRLADHQSFFRKPTRPSLPLRKAPHLSPSLSLLRRERMCQPPYSVLKPLRYKVGGPSEVYASSGAAVFVRDEPHGHTMLDAYSMLI